MDAYQSAAERDVRAFVERFPTPNARRALRLCEESALPWEKVADLFARSLVAASAEVARCAKHPAFDADHCPQCGTATVIRHDL